MQAGETTVALTPDARTTADLTNAAFRQIGMIPGDWPIDKPDTDIGATASSIHQSRQPDQIQGAHVVPPCALFASVLADNSVKEDAKIFKVLLL
jgi:hypothetical protein